MKTRIVFLDYLRIAACLMVMAIHAAECFYLGGEAPNVAFIASRSDAFWVTATECVCRACVPLFVIASSYLLFPVSRPTGEFFRRRFVRIFIPFAIWAAAYVIAAGGDMRQLAFNFPDEGGHLWFVPMLLGLYLAMPLLSPWAEKAGKRELAGWILLWLATTTFPFLRRIWGGIFGEPPFGAVPYLWGECPWNPFGAFHYVSGFFGYMLLGLWLRKFGTAMSWRKTLAVALPMWLVGATIIGVPFFLYADAFPFSATYSHAVRMEMSIEYNSLGVALTTLATFLILRKVDFQGAFYRWLVRPVSEASYGMYLMHMFILPAAVAAIRPHTPTALCILLAALATFAASALVALALRRIPRIGTWLCG
ncbi:MAG: acyltransferase [Kiritimatiellia bacterium]